MGWKEIHWYIFHLPETHPQMGISHWSMNDYHFPCQPTLHARATYKPRFEKQPCQPSDWLKIFILPCPSQLKCCHNHLIFYVTPFHVQFRLLKQRILTLSTIVRQAVCVDIHVLLFASRNTVQWHLRKTIDQSRHMK